MPVGMDGFSIIRQRLYFGAGGYEAHPPYHTHVQYNPLQTQTTEQLIAHFKEQFSQEGEAAQAKAAGDLAAIWDEGKRRVVLQALSQQQRLLYVQHRLVASAPQARQQTLLDLNALPDDQKVAAVEGLFQGSSVYAMVQAARVLPTLMGPFRDRRNRLIARLCQDTNPEAKTMGLKLLPWLGDNTQRQALLKEAEAYVDALFQNAKNRSHPLITQLEKAYGSIADLKTLYPVVQFQETLALMKSKVAPLKRPWLPRKTPLNIR